PVRRQCKMPESMDAETYPATHGIVEKLSTPEGRERYRDRKHIVEAVNGWIKQVMGFRRFSIRGLCGVSGEWDLVCLAANLRRMRPLIEFGWGGETEFYRSGWEPGRTGKAALP